MKFYGSITNRLEEQMVGRPSPVVGIGGYLSYWSDRNPYYVESIEYYKNGNIKALNLIAPKCHSKACYSNDWEIETFEQTIARAKKGEYMDRRIVWKTRSGSYTVNGLKDGTPFLIGHCDKYYDYEF